MSTINPRILDASIHDVCERLSPEQKAEILIHAMNLLKLAHLHSHHLVENGVLSCIQAASLATPQLVQALLLRGRARMAAGDTDGARRDLHKVLDLQPDHAVATSLLAISNSAVTKSSRLWNIDSASRRLSPELWRHIARYLPRRDLKTLLRLPHVLSRIAFELVFQRVDLHLGAVLTDSADGGEYESYDADDDPDRPGFKLEKWLVQRTADIVSRIVLDPGFARLIKVIRVSATPRDKTQHMAFGSTMLATALPKLVNLQEVQFVGSNIVWNKLAELIGATHPRLRGLTFKPMHDTEPTLPRLSGLTKFQLVLDHSCHSLSPFLAQNRNTLRRLSLDTYYATFPHEALILNNLTHLEFNGTVPAGSNVISQILTQGTQLQSLRLCCVLLGNVTSQFKEALSGMGGRRCVPRLRSFAFRVTDRMATNAADIALFPTIAEFLREHPAIERLELDVSAETDQARLGYDASILGVLPCLTELKRLSITMTKDASPGLFSWIIPRKLVALALAGLPRRSTDAFLINMKAGLPSTLRFIALNDITIHDPLQTSDVALPSSVRLAHMNNKYFTVRRRPDGMLDTLEEWPTRRAEVHAKEWFESMGCEYASADEFC